MGRSVMYRVGLCLSSYEENGEVLQKLTIKTAGRNVAINEANFINFSGGIHFPD